MKRSVFALIVIVFVHLYRVPAYPQSLDLNAKAYILIDSESGRVLYEKNSDQRVHPASTTKIMTALLAIELGKPDQIMTADNSAVLQRYIEDGVNLGIGINGTNVGLIAGEEVKLEDLLNVLLIKSANDAANIIADNLTGSRAGFIDLMNERAVELGAANTSFTNACGLDVQDGHPEHFTTASDLAKIARHSMTLEKFREIVVKIKHSMPATNKHQASYWPADYLTTTNKLLLYNRYKSDLYQVTGIKTGYTVNSGFNMVASGKNDQGMELISVVLGSQAADSHYAYSKELLDYGFQNFSIQKIFDEGITIETTEVKNSKDDLKLELVTQKELTCVMPVDTGSWNIERKDSIAENIEAPVKKGDVLGYSEFIQNGESLGKVNLIAASSVDRKENPLNSLKGGLKVFDNPDNAGNGENSLFQILSGLPIFLISFVIFRTALKKVSRQIKKKRRQKMDIS